MLSRLTEIVEVTAGVGVLACGLWVFFPVLLFPSGTKQMLLMLLLTVAPGFLVTVGCCLQTVQYKWWGILFVGLGGLCTFKFTLRLGVLFVYFGHTWLLPAVWADQGLLLLAFIAACVQTFLLVLVQR